MASLSWSRWARAYYDHHKAQHQAHATILRGLGQKWAKIVYAVWSSGSPITSRWREIRNYSNIQDLGFTGFLMMYFYRL